MKRAVFILVFVFSLYSAVSEAAYRVHLKNGSVIVGVTHIERANGEVILYFHGGTVGIPDGDILKIEEYTSIEKKPPVEAPSVETDLPPAPFAAPPSPAAPPAPAPSPEAKKAEAEKIASLKKKLDEINREIEAINAMEQGLSDMKEEFRRVRLRIENLYQTGRKRALADGKSETQYLQYLTPEERGWIQSNFIKKRQMEPDIERAEAELSRFLEGKERLLREKEKTEEEIRKLGP